MQSFRPQQGLTIMNYKRYAIPKAQLIIAGFRPQQGLTIMNEFGSSI